MTFDDKGFVQERGLFLGGNVLIWKRLVQFLLVAAAAFGIGWGLATTLTFVAIGKVVGNLIVSGDPFLAQQIARYFALRGGQLT